MSDLFSFTLAESLLGLNMLLVILSMELDEQARETKDPATAGTFDTTARAMRLVALLCALGALLAMRKAIA